MTSWPSRLAIALASAAALPLGPPAAHAVRAIVPPARSSQSDTSLAAAQRALRAAVTAQEQYYNVHKTYAGSVRDLARLMPMTPRVSIQILHADARGWTGSGRVQGSPGRSCVIYVGLANANPELPATDRERRRPTREAIPVCDPD